MSTHTCSLVLVSAMVILPLCTSAFFLNWGSPQPIEAKPDQQMQLPVIAYYQRRSQIGPQYAIENGVPVKVPAIPIQTPLKAQMSPVSNIQNVQLVPCLCPVAQDYDFEKNPNQNIYIDDIKPIQN